MALSVWGAPPCVTPVHVVPLEAGVLGSVRIEDGVCEIKVAARRWQFWELCAVLVHEVGHAHGLPHSDDPFDVMYPMLWRPADVCRGKRPPQFPRGAVIRLP